MSLPSFSAAAAEPGGPPSFLLKVTALIPIIKHMIASDMAHEFDNLVRANLSALNTAFFGKPFVRNRPDWYHRLIQDIFFNVADWDRNGEAKLQEFRQRNPDMSLEDHSVQAVPQVALTESRVTLSSSSRTLASTSPTWTEFIETASPINFAGGSMTETGLLDQSDETYIFSFRCDDTAFHDVFNILYDESHQNPPTISMLDIVRHFENGLWRSIAYQIQINCEGRTQVMNDDMKLFGPIQVNEKPQGRMPRSFPENFFYEYLPSSIVVDEVSHSSLARLCMSFKASYPHFLATERRHRRTAALRFARKMFFSHKLIIKVAPLTPSGPSVPSSSSTASEEVRPTMMERRFCRFLAWSYSPSRRIYPFIPKKLVEMACGKMDSSCIGVHSLMKKIAAGFAHFSNTIKDVPHGVLLWGPPGTGKTHIVSLINEYMDVYPVCPDLASGDFNRPYQGLSEAMVNDIRERALTVPWQLVSLAIDEIDGLAPSRDGAQSSGNKTDLLSVVLSIVGGNRNTLNLLLLGSTNRFDKMDEAFRRRLPLKYFVGKPNFRSRVDWILWRMVVDKLPFGLVWNQPSAASSASTSSNRLVPLPASFGLDGEEEDEDLLALLKEDEQLRMQFGLKMAPTQDSMTPKDAVSRGQAMMEWQGYEAMSEVVNMLASLTTNFSHDAMRRLLSDFAVYRMDPTKNNFKDPILSPEVCDFALETARAERIYLGNALVPELLRAVTGLRHRIRSRNPSPSNADSQIRPLSKLIPDLRRLNNLKRLLIELHVQPSTSSPLHIIPQVHCLFSNFISADILLRIVQNVTQTSGPNEFVDAVEYLTRLGILNKEGYSYPLWEKHLADLKAGFDAEWTSEIPRGLLSVSDSTTLRDAMVSLIYCAEFISNCTEDVPSRLSSSPDPQHICMKALKMLATHHPASQTLLEGIRLNNLSGSSDRIFKHIAILLLHSRAIIAYMIELAKSKTAHEPFVRRYGLQASQTESGLSLQDILAYCIDFGDKFEVDVVNLVDSEALVAAERLTPDQAESYLSTLLEESREYESSLTILNLSSVAGLSKSYESATAGTVLRSIAMDRRDSTLDGMKYTYSIQRPAALEKMLNWFYTKDDATKHWVVAVSDDAHLSSRLRSKFSTFEWPLTSEEDAIIKKEKGDEKMCFRCRLQYKESENKDDSCTGHPGRPSFRRPGATGAQPIDLDQQHPWDKVVDLQTLQKTLKDHNLSDDAMFDPQVSFWTCCRKSLYDTCLFHQKHASSAEEAKQNDPTQTKASKNARAASS
jgi:hypothetical protein